MWLTHAVVMQLPGMDGVNAKAMVMRKGGESKAPVLCTHTGPLVSLTQDTTPERLSILGTFS